jgi:hypothetical protein
MASRVASQPDHKQERPILLGKYVACMVCSSLKCKHIADSLEKRVWAFSSSLKKGILVCSEQSKNISAPPKHRLWSTQTITYIQKWIRMWGRIESKIGISFRKSLAASGSGSVSSGTAAITASSLLIPPFLFKHREDPV